VFGCFVDKLRSRLGESRSFAERIRVADDYLLLRGVGGAGQSDITAAARELARHHGCLRISDLAERAGLSIRQFERRFNSQIGMPPKVYARVVRFEAALKSKKRSPSLRWTDIALALGYHDHMHMVHDFQRLSGATPSTLAPQVDMFVEREIDETPRP
jgi:transcriptional regulator GlxA family with amidase domain